MHSACLRDCTTDLQSYNETVDLIYKSNTYHVDNLSFLSSGRNKHVPRRLLHYPSPTRPLYFPPRMSTITSLEVVCNLLIRVLLGQHDEYNNHRHWEQFEFMLDYIPESFTSLRKLEISVHPTDIFSPIDERQNEQIIKMHETMLLKPIDAVRSKYGSQLVHLSLAVPHSHHVRLMERAMAQEARNEKVGDGRLSFWRYWRAVKESNEPINAVSLGYWIREGVDNTSTNAVSYARSFHDAH